MIGRMSMIIDRANTIDSLRGMAALMVVLMHAKGMLWVGISETWARNGLAFDISAWLGYATAPLVFGYLGVPLFFVLSGYCIHHRGAHALALDKAARIDLKKFTLRRFMRIYPVYFTVLCITALVDAIVIADHHIVLDQTTDDSLAAFLASLLTLQGVVAPTFGNNGVFWTLSVEIHLYAAYPVLFYLSRRYGPGKTLGFALAASIAYILVDDSLGIRQSLPSRYGIGPIFLSYWFTWAIGFYLAEVRVGRARLPAGFYAMAAMSAAIYALLFLYEKFGHQQIAGTFLYDSVTTVSIAIAFGGLVSWAVTPHGERRLSGFAGRKLAKVGVFSYSLYAVHVPILSLFKSTLVGAGFSTTTLVPFFFGVLLSLVGAWFLFLVVEQWSLRAPVRLAQSAA